MAEVSLFIGAISSLPESGRLTGIYKSPVSGPIYLGVEGFVGDHQADRKVHGGPDKAVHLYPTKHYADLALKFPEVSSALLAGSLGENLATLDLDESHVRIGDVWQLGAARLQVCQPRNPCWKIDEKFGCEGMALYIAEKFLTGWYWRVTLPGVVTPGDPLVLVDQAKESMTLREAMVVWQNHRPDLMTLRRLADSPGIASSWKDKVTQRICYLSNLI